MLVMWQRIQGVIINHIEAGFAMVKIFQIQILAEFGKMQISTSYTTLNRYLTVSYDTSIIGYTN
jgi:hypothetical protein